MKPWGWIAIGVLSGLVGGLFAAGAIVLVSSPPRGEAVTLLPPPTAASILVHVSGGVNQPGMVALPPGSRVKDAIAAAGGVYQGDEQALNLAAEVQDGEKVWVPLLPEPTWTPSPLSTQTFSDRSSSPLQLIQPSEPQQAQPEKVNINTGSVDDLESLPGIGPALARRIIEYRDAHGPFAKIEDIQDVSGIGSALYKRIKDLITVGGE